MSPLMLRQLWSIVERTQAHVLLSLDDTNLVQWLLKQLRTDSNEVAIYSHYIQSRLPLIRDMARGRSAA
ncbi:hypothetical protein H6F43_14830 [Leptolyngbya sp. FACHB-36]|uniref:hypothetical protein n=1 Tax=Leptolyngbya sp. FACHB-36 TaxID=2692808 RepID=UPI0016803511|nr:hypothetical protein [Leptolyngbya sp. FACHB-36]MBD2021452.1 hypothetical protein [Leptolyngbya sp. FACHB-36]